jgi:hypothetical protein
MSPDPTKDISQQAENQTSIASAEQETGQINGASMPAPAFSISAGSDRELTDEELELGEDYLDDILGGENSVEDIDELFGAGFADKFSFRASRFEAIWSDLSNFNLGANDKQLAKNDHSVGGAKMDALIGCIIEALTGPEENVESQVNEGQILIEEIDICTDLLGAYVTLFSAIESKNVLPIITALLEMHKLMNFADYRDKVLKIEAETRELKKHVDDAYKALAAAGIDTAIDIGAILLETSILSAIGVANPLLGGIIMMGLVYGSKEISNGIIKPPSKDEPMGSYLITKSDESLDLLSKGMEASGKASEQFKGVTGKIGKFKGGITGLMGVANTTKAFYDVQKLEAFFKEYEANNKEILAQLAIDFEEKIMKAGAMSKNIYNIGLELGPTIENSLSDIDNYKTELEEFRNE